MLGSRALCTVGKDSLFDLEAHVSEQLFFVLPVDFIGYRFAWGRRVGEGIETSPGDQGKERASPFQNQR